MNSIKIALISTVLGIGALFAEEAAKDGGETVKAGNFSFEAKKPWLVQAPKSRMVKAVLLHGEKGPELKFYHFGPGQGGGVEANITRWKKQFEGEPKVSPETKIFGKQEVKIVMMEGTFLDGPVMQKKTPREGWSMLGAVIPHPSGDVFLKMAGPTAEVQTAKKNFEALINSAFSEQ